MKLMQAHSAPALSGKRMKLVYKTTGEPVKVGDPVEIKGVGMTTVEYFREPHKPDSEGRVSLASGAEYYVSVIGAEWIEREDRIVTLRDVMPHELFGGSYDDTPAHKLADVRVKAEYRPYKGGGDPAWPGPQKHVMFWVLLENGKAVGWNENPSHGWSFPVVSAKALAA